MLVSTPEASTVLSKEARADIHRLAIRFISGFKVPHATRMLVSRILRTKALSRGSELTPAAARDEGVRGLPHQEGFALGCKAATSSTMEWFTCSRTGGLPVEPQNNPMILRMIDWRGCSAVEYVPGTSGEPPVLH